MAVAQLPDFDHTLALSQGNLDVGTLAECHGVACGLLVRQPGSRAEAFLGLLDVLGVLQRPGEAMRSALTELFQAAGLQLADVDMGLEIWLPDDEEPLEDRTLALTQWCNGFLAALGSDREGCLETLSDEAGEALADLGEIARAEMSDEELDEDADLEDEEQAFTEIVEYIRVAVLTVHEDLRGPMAGDSIH